MDNSWLRLRCCIFCPAARGHSSFPKRLGVAGSPTPRISGWEGLPNQIVLSLATCWCRFYVDLVSGDRLSWCCHRDSHLAQGRNMLIWVTFDGSVGPKPPVWVSALPLSCFLCAILCDPKSIIALLQYPCSEKYTFWSMHNYAVHESVCTRASISLSGISCWITHHQCISVFSCGIVSGFRPTCAGGTLSGSQWSRRFSFLEMKLLTA